MYTTQIILSIYYKYNSGNGKFLLGIKIEFVLNPTRNLTPVKRTIYMVLTKIINN